jgi:hypothetical protein
LRLCEKLKALLKIHQCPIKVILKFVANGLKSIFYQWTPLNFLFYLHAKPLSRQAFNHSADFFAPLHLCIFAPLREALSRIKKIHQCPIKVILKFVANGLKSIFYQWTPLNFLFYLHAKPLSR